MGCDIYCFTEKKKKGEYVCLGKVFNSRNYSLFGFLANIRNYSKVPPLDKPRGLPQDVSSEVLSEAEKIGSDGHSYSYLTLNELNKVDYGKTFEDRRYTKKVAENAWSGIETCEAGQGVIRTYSEFLGDSFIDELKKVTDSGAERIVFWFYD